MRIDISEHAKNRMQEYDIAEKLVEDSIRKPDIIAEGYGGRKIYQKRINSYTLRAVVEENKEIRVITVYKARSGRYGI